MGYITLDQFLSFDYKLQKKVLKTLSESNIKTLCLECESLYKEALNIDTKSKTYNKKNETHKLSFKTINKYASIYTLLSGYGSI